MLPEFAENEDPSQTDQAHNSLQNERICLILQEDQAHTKSGQASRGVTADRAGMACQGLLGHSGGANGNRQKCRF